MESTTAQIPDLHPLTLVLSQCLAGALNACLNGRYWMALEDIERAHALAGIITSYPSETIEA